ncbi:antibiotic biosynthesis monooxygenase [Providencia zhijiangensis]|uniref:Antibiotic biosynthesis monooxygenase n=1 Tax=Providencia zhijiangensis TaxID=3053982 RepID=A0ABZ0N736_9GAMM|nr:antibiotic biosynthesis monooxygenase [Providencia sp. D4759]WPA93785.1 antibiotic biosynthesis monooxygenase [Providencia sp. D4759]
MIAVIFEARIAPNKQERYLSLAEKLKPLLSDIEGFISIERFQSLSNEGKMICNPIACNKFELICIEYEPAFLVGQDFYYFIMTCKS